MPQMSPMLWLLIFMLSLMNLFIFMFLMNSMFLKLNFNNLIKYNSMKWKWIW